MMFLPAANQGQLPSIMSCVSTLVPGVRNSDGHVDIIHHLLGLPGSVATRIPWTAS